VSTVKWIPRKATADREAAEVGLSCNGVRTKSPLLMIEHYCRQCW